MAMRMAVTPPAASPQILDNNPKKTGRSISNHFKALLILRLNDRLELIWKNRLYRCKVRHFGPRTVPRSPGHRGFGADENTALSMGGRDVGNSSDTAPSQLLRIHPDPDRLEMPEDGFCVLGIADL